MAAVLVTIETSGERGEIKPTAPSRTLLTLWAPDIRASWSGDRTQKARALSIRTVAAVAIYEEDELMRALLKEWLSEAGYRVRGAAPGGVARGGGEDLVIASVYTPKRAGAALLREIQAAHPGTPLIAISGQFRSGLSAAGTTAQMPGVERVLAKPLTRGELLQAVRAIIGAPTARERTECPQ